MTNSPERAGEELDDPRTSSTRAIRLSVPAVTRRVSSTLHVLRKRPVRVSPGARLLTVTFYGAELGRQAAGVIDDRRLGRGVDHTLPRPSYAAIELRVTMRPERHSIIPRAISDRQELW